jgi:hypothetical protein
MANHIPYYMPVKMNGNQIINFRVDPVASDYDGASLTEAKFWYNTTDHKLRFFDGTVVKTVATGDALETAITMAVEATAANALIVSAGADRSAQQYVPGSGNGGMLTISDAGIVGTKSILDSTGTISSSSTDNQIPTALAVNNAISAAITAMGVFVGDFDASSGALPTTGSGESGAICKGDYWRVSVAGDITGLQPSAHVEVGDVLVAKANAASTAADFFVLQGNITDAITGSSVSSTDTAVAIFDGTNARVIKASGVTIDASGNVNIPSGAVYKINGVAHTHALTDLSDNTNGITFANIEAKTDKYQASFTTTDWVGDAAPYSITVASATHGLTGVANVMVLDSNSDYAGVAINVSATDAVVINSMEKFAGSISIIGTIDYSA